MSRSHRVALFGASGQLGVAIRKLAPSHWEIQRPTRREADFLDGGLTVTAWLEKHRPQVVINAAAYNAVEQAEKEPMQARQINAQTPANLATWASNHGAYLVHFSSDYVFSGQDTEPIKEDSPPEPVNAYGTSKAEGEKLFCHAEAEGCLIRTSAVFGPREQPPTSHNFVEKIIVRASGENPFPVREDLTFCPTWSMDLARVTLQKIEDRASGIFHCTSMGATTWLEWAREILAQLGKNSDLAEPCRGNLAGGAPRPQYTVLKDSFNHPSTPWQSALKVYLRERLA